MARVWEVLPGGRLKRFRNRPVRHRCAKRRRGRPAVGYGLCYGVTRARAERRALEYELQRAGWGAPKAVEEVARLVSAGVRKEGDTKEGDTTRSA